MLSALTRKRVNDRPESWHIHFAGVRVGRDCRALRRAGVDGRSVAVWSCGFYRGVICAITVTA